MSRGEASGNPSRNRWIATHSLLAGLLLAAALAPCQVRAQTNTAKAAPSSQRWLLIVETSHSMQRRADAVLQTVQDLLRSGLNGQLRQGDTLGIWTFNEGLYAGRFPLQTWSPEAQRDIASRALAFVKAQKYEKQANFGKVLPALDRVIKGSAHITVILISSGDDKMRGTPFDSRINEFYQKWHDQQQKARMPFVTVLRARAGQLADYTLNTPPWPTQLPRLSQETLNAEALQNKLLEALRNPPHRVGQQAADQSVQRALLAAFPFNNIVAIFLLNRDAPRDGYPEGSFRSAHHHGFPLRLHGYAGRYLNKLCTNS